MVESHKEELKSLDDNNTWRLTTLPNGKKVLHNKWVFRLKEEVDGKKKYKARLVVKGFQQIQNLDYSKVLSCGEDDYHQGVAEYSCYF